MKNFHYRFLRNYESYKVETWYTHLDSGLLYLVYQNQGQGPVNLGVTSLKESLHEMSKSILLEK